MSLFLVVLEYFAWSSVGVAKPFGLPAPRGPEYGSKLKYGKLIQVTNRELSNLPSDARESWRSVGSRRLTYFPSDAWTAVT